MPPEPLRNDDVMRFLLHRRTAVLDATDDRGWTAPHYAAAAAASLSGFAQQLASPRNVL